MLALLTACETGHPAAYELAKHELGEAPELITNQIDLNGNGRNEFIYALKTAHAVSDANAVFAIRHRGKVVIEQNDTDYQVLITHTIGASNQMERWWGGRVDSMVTNPADYQTYHLEGRRCKLTNKPYLIFSLLSKTAGASDGSTVAWSPTNRKFEMRYFDPCSDLEQVPEHFRK